MEDIQLDLSNEEESSFKEISKKEDKKRNNKPITKKSIDKPEGELINPLRNERVIVRFLPRKSGIWGNNPKHVLAGGMSENAVRTFVVPKLSSGVYVNVLTDNEKAFLENALGLEYNAMSVYKRQDNFWSDANPHGINKVKLAKQDNYFDLSNPEDYIKYKILLANKNFIAPSLEILQDRYKATYQFVIIEEKGKDKAAKTEMSYTMECYAKFGKIEDDIDILRVVVESLSGKATTSNTTKDFLHSQCNEYIKKDPKTFLKIVKDPYLPTKVLMKKAKEAGLISKRGDFYYIKNIDGNVPMCEEGEEPTFNVAAKFLSAAKHQELKFSLEAKLQ